MEWKLFGQILALMCFAAVLVMSVIRDANGK